MMDDQALRRAGWTVDADGLGARLPMNRFLPALLTLLAAAGGVMYLYFLVVTDGPYRWPVYVAPVVLLLMLYAALRGLRNTAYVSFRGGVFQCTFGAIGTRDTLSFALADLKGFELHFPSNHRELPCVVAKVQGDTLALPIPIGDAAPVSTAKLARAIASALEEMLERARRARDGYR